MEGLVALVPLHPAGFLKQIPLLEMINDEIKEVDMHYPESGPVFGDVGHEELNMFPDAQFRSGRIVEDVEGNFVPKAFAAEKFGGNDLWEDFI